MTTLAPTAIKYLVTLRYCAEDWANSENEDGSTNYDTQPLTERSVVVYLPTNASPWDIYSAADELIDVSDVLAELAAEGGTGYDGDGFSIQREDINTEFVIPYDTIKPNTSWDDFYQRNLTN